VEGVTCYGPLFAVLSLRKRSRRGPLVVAAAVRSQCVYYIKYAGERVRDVYDVSRTTAVARGRPAAVRRANAVRTPHAATTATPHHRNKKNQIESKTGRASLLTRVPWYDHPVPSARARVRMWVCVYGNNIIHAHAHATPRRYRAGECVVRVVYICILYKRSTRLRRRRPAVIARPDKTSDDVRRAAM